MKKRLASKENKMLETWKVANDLSSYLLVFKAKLYLNDFIGFLLKFYGNRTIEMLFLL